MADSAVAQPQLEQKTRTLPPYRVILHNDDVNTFEHVILSILKLTQLEEHAAIQCALTAHQEGCATMLITHKERAELYCEQFATYQLTVTCEPDC